MAYLPPPRASGGYSHSSTPLRLTGFHAFRPSLDPEEEREAKANHEARPRGVEAGHHLKAVNLTPLK